MTVADVPPRVGEAPGLAAADVPRAFGRRILALMVDLLALSLVNSLVNLVFGVTHVTSGTPVSAFGAGVTQFTTASDVGWAWPVVMMLVYFVGLEALFGATIGKWLLSLRVTDRDGRRPAFWPVVIRNLARLVDALPIFYLVGGVIALSSPLRQRLGDRLARTVVIRSETLAVPLLTRVQARRRFAMVSAILLACVSYSAAFFYYGRPPLVIQSMVNTRQMMFSDGVSDYTLGPSTWEPGAVIYQVTYRTTYPVKTCHARLTLDWAFPTGWEPRNGESQCETPTP
ncbi:MAG TPA: RDD family protein [Ktedonobacterales bacterium]|nr:RDD family protein [Ktedonobacterales bacterium]